MRIITITAANEPPAQTCTECGDWATHVISFGRGSSLALCEKDRRELRNLIGRARQPRPVNRKQFLALEKIARSPGQRATGGEILRAMGRYATNSFKSCVTRELIRPVNREITDRSANPETGYELTAKGRELWHMLGGRA